MSANSENSQKAVNCAFHNRYAPEILKLFAVMEKFITIEFTQLPPMDLTVIAQLLPKTIRKKASIKFILFGIHFIGLFLFHAIVFVSVMKPLKSDNCLNRAGWLIIKILFRLPLLNTKL